MAHQSLFGTLRYDENQHRWTLDLGSRLANWITLRSLSDGVEEQKKEALIRELELGRQEINRLLYRHQIRMGLPEAFTVQSDEALDIVDHVTDVVGALISPSHQGFVLLASAHEYIACGRRISETSARHDPPFDTERIGESCQTLARMNIGKLARACASCFPMGVRLEQLMAELRACAGSLDDFRDRLLEARRPISIMLVFSDPGDQGRTRLRQEEQRLRESLERSTLRDLFVLHVLSDASADNLGLAITRARPTIVHFSGHGDQHGFFLADRQGRSNYLPPERLARIIRLEQTGNLKGVVMNACYSADQARQMGNGIGDMIVMDNVIGEEAALSFSEQFYAQLCEGHSFEDAFIRGSTYTDLTGTGGNFQPVFIRRT